MSNQKTHRINAHYKLQLALQEATECGLLDAIAGDIHPNAINQFCDAIDNYDADAEKTKENPHTAETTVYVTITVKCRVCHLSGESPDNIASRVAENADYNITLEDDICEIVDTEIIDATTSNPL